MPATIATTTATAATSGNTDEQTLSREWQALCAGVAAGGFKLKEEHVVLTGICKQCQK